MQAYIETDIVINAAPAKVWDALVNPEMTARYMFGCWAVSGWKPGDRLDWVGQMEGKDMTFVTGQVVECLPNQKLVYTVIDPFATYPQTPENHLTVSCTLTEVDGGTQLAVSQGDYSKVAEGERRYGDGAAGWSQLLNTIKELIEREG